MWSGTLFKVADSADGYQHFHFRFRLKNGIIYVAAIVCGALTGLLISHLLG